MLFIYRGAIQGLKDGLIPMIDSILEVVMRVISPILLSPIIGFWSICIAGPAAWSASAIFMIVTYYFKFKKGSHS